MMTRPRGRSQTASWSRADWVMLLEDDVSVIRPIDLNSIQHDLNGDNKNTALSGVNKNNPPECPQDRHMAMILMATCSSLIDSLSDDRLTQNFYQCGEIISKIHV